MFPQITITFPKKPPDTHPPSHYNQQMNNNLNQIQMKKKGNQLGLAGKKSGEIGSLSGNATVIPYGGHANPKTFSLQ